MSIRSIEDERGRALLVTFIEQHTLPFVIEITKGKHRSIQQNKLQQKWFEEAARDLGESHEYWRGYCKLHYGVPIRRNTSEIFKAAYDRDLRDLPYEMKLRLMMVPFDMPVTRDMKAKEMKQYLDEVQKFFLGRGVALTDPESLRWGQFERDNDRSSKRSNVPPRRVT